MFRRNVIIVYRDVYIHDLITDEQRVVNKTFERCTIFGPATLWLFKCNIINIAVEGNLGSLYVVALTNYAPAGTIIVKHCTFIDCKFRRISICYGDINKDRVRSLIPATTVEEQ